MTLIVAVACRDGLVLGADGQRTQGSTKEETEKVFPFFNGRGLWAIATNKLGLLDAVRERLPAGSANAAGNGSEVGDPVRDGFCRAMTDAFEHAVDHSIYSLSKFGYSSELFVAAAATEFVVASVRNDANGSPSVGLYTVALNGTPESRTGPGRFAIAGSGRELARALLHPYIKNRLSLSVDDATDIVYDVIRTVAECTLSVSEPRELWQVHLPDSEPCFRRLTDSELIGLSDASRSRVADERRNLERRFAYQGGEVLTAEEQPQETEHHGD